MRVTTKPLKFKQICVGQWDGGSGGGLTYTVIGLSEDGEVYKAIKDGWVRVVGAELAPGASPTKRQPYSRYNPNDDAPL